MVLRATCCHSLASVEASLNNLIAILCCLIKLKITYLNDCFIVTGIDLAKTHVDCGARVCILRADVNKVVLKTSLLRDINWILVTLLLFVWFYT